MITSLRILTVAALFAVTPAAAQSSNSMATYRPLHLPASTHVSPQVASRISRQIWDMLHQGNRGASQQKAASNPDKLLAIASYDYTLPPNAQSTDSMRFFYNSSRGSAYDFYSLNYDYNNGADRPNSSFGSASQGYVAFDTAFGYPSSGSINGTIKTIRNYDVSGKINLIEDIANNTETHFIYDGSGKLIKATTLQDNGTGTLDSAYEDIYVYNAAGYVVADSMLSWTGSSWQTNGASVFTLNAAGYPTQFKFVIGTGPFSFTVFQADVNYNAAALPASLIVRQIGSVPGALVNYERDTFNYSGSMLVYHNMYQWDTLGNIWTLFSSERRRLNAAGLPDSVFVGTVPGSGATYDSSVVRIAYNTNGNPVYQRTYAMDNTTMLDEQRYYYSFETSVSVPIVHRDLAIFPNPVQNELFFSGIATRNYRIINALGQVLESCSVQSNVNRISVQYLPSGSYLLIMDDVNGVPHAGRFSKQ